MTAFDRDGVAADFAAIPTELLAPKPRALSHPEAAAVPLAALSAWQGLFDHGRLAAGERVLIHGATGGVGQFATPLASRHGAHVTATSPPSAAAPSELGAAVVIDYAAGPWDPGLEPFDLVFDTAGGERLARSAGALRAGGRRVSVAEHPPEATGVSACTSSSSRTARSSCRCRAARRWLGGPRYRLRLRARGGCERLRAQPAAGKHGKVVLEVARNR